MSRASVVALLVCLLGACGVEPRSPELSPSDAGAPPREAGALPEPTKPVSVRLPRSPWLGTSDEVAQRFPAYGVTLYFMTQVYEAPRKDARIVGYLRRGARFRASEEVTRKGCARGWFEVPGEGFVCNGDGVLVDSQPPAYEDAPLPAALSDALPYRYAKVVSANVPQFVRMPTLDEERTVSSAIAPMAADAGSDALAQALPAELAGLLRVRMQPGFYVSVDREEVDAASERAFVRSIRGGFVRKELLLDGKLPQGIGVALGRRFTLPLAFVYRGGAPLLRLDPVTGEAVKVGGDLALHAAYALTGETVVRSGRRYFVTTDGFLLRDTAVRVVEKISRPRTVPRGERWIRVDLDRQTLTAYDGDTPVFATLVSSGLADHATPLGVYRLHAKHVTATMADDLAADGPYSIEDVPWTMYFYGSYALHAAFWHDRFGHQRSHGCVNLAPRDARWLFFWTLPELPSAWHGVLANVGEGTTVVLDTGVPYALEQPH